VKDCMLVRFNDVLMKKFILRYKMMNSF
jgi:hypothetical protein